MKLYTTANVDEIKEIVFSQHPDPHHILGMHEVDVEGENVVAVRAFLPEVECLYVVKKCDGSEYAMERISDEGFFEAVFEEQGVFEYTLKAENYNGDCWEFEDPYRFSPSLSEFDLYLLGEGNHHDSFKKLGAHVVEIDGVKGTRFAVWAPNAKRVSVIGNFNGWDGRRHPMRNLKWSGYWELFIPDITTGETYKYEIKTRENHLLEKADPYAFYAEKRPCTASVVYNLDGFDWSDEGWMETRKEKNTLGEPMAIYEVHAGSWMRVVEEENRFMTYVELAHKLVPYVKEMGYTHIELLGIAEHPFDGSWGYQVTGYYAPTSRFGTPKDFMYFVDYCHQHGIGLILDWVPAHFPKDAHGLARFDGTALYEHADPKQGEHPDWGTLIFNYGRNEVRNFLISNAVYWMEKYHIDGLRVDAVASMLYLDYGKTEGNWIPNCFGGRENLDAVNFMKQLNTVVYERFPGITMIAEESTAWAGVSKPVYTGGLGFGLKWNMGWMNDFLRYIEKDPIHRKYHHNDLTFSMVYAYTENFILVLSHDEVVHGKGSMIRKMPGDDWQKFANLRTAYGFMYAHPGKKLLFMGGEFAQWDEWRAESSLDWHLLNYTPHNGIQKFVKDLNHLYRTEPALSELDATYEGFEWIDGSDYNNSIVSFKRKGKDPNEQIIFVCNFTPVPHMEYRVGVDQLGYYKEILNSDAAIYGGSGCGNLGGVYAQEQSWNYRSHSLQIALPPLSVVAFKRAE